jgi:hypothetical protein
MTQQQPGGMNLAQFMNHSTRGGGRNTYFKWENSAIVWLSCQSSIYSLWRHGFKKVEVRENRETKEKTVEVWSDQLRCFEAEEDLNKRNFRDKESKAREYPPRICPVCKMNEDVYQRCRDGNETMRQVLAKSPKAPQHEIEKILADKGEICWLTPLFRFNGIVKGEGGAVVGDHQILHAGGLYNAFGNKDLTPDDKARMAGVPKDLGGPIYAAQAWRENNQPKVNYVYVIVNHEKPGDGLQVAVVPSLLGDKMRGEIAKQMKRLGGGENGPGNPILHPYAFQWENKGKGASGFVEYDATALDQIKITPAVQKLILDTPAPDLTGLLSFPNLQSLRARLEKHALIQLPWDEYFEDAVKAEAARGQQAAEAAERPREVGRSLPAPVPMARAAQGPDAQPARPHAPPPEEEMVACDGKLPSGQECGNPIKLSDPQCPVCKTKFDVQAEEPPPPPVKPALRSRGAAKASAVAPPAAPTASATVGAPRGSLGALAPPADAFEQAEAHGLPGDPEDDLPF